MNFADLHMPLAGLVFATIAAAQAPTLVRDINPGAASSQPREAADLGAITLWWVWTGDPRVRYQAEITPPATCRSGR